MLDFHHTWQTSDEKVIEIIGQSFSEKDDQSKEILLFRQLQDGLLCTVMESSSLVLQGVVYCS